MEQVIVRKEFKVGDKIIVQPRFGKSFSYTITRLTKTQAVAEWVSKNGGKLCEKFGREYHNYLITEQGAEPKYKANIRRIPIGDFIWDTNTYEVVEN